MTNLPLISIITVSYNAISTIEKTIYSVLTQTYSNIEYIIIDGGSTDGTVDVIKKYNDKLTYWVSEPDKGIYDAMNKGIDKTTGDWVNFMNSGDLFHSLDVIEKFISTVSQGTEIAYGDTMMVLSIGTYLQKVKPLELITQQMVFGHQATFVHRKIFDNLRFNIMYHSSGDYDFFYRTYQKGFVFEYLPIIVVDYEGDMGVSMKNYLLARREDARIQGIEDKISWKMKFKLFCIVYKFKRVVKSLLPQSFLRKIQVCNAEKRFMEI